MYVAQAIPPIDAEIAEKGLYGWKLNRLYAQQYQYLINARST